MRSLSVAMTWTRRVEACGHDVRWMAAKYVRPVCRSQRNGFNDQQAMPRPSHGPNPIPDVNTLVQLDLPALRR